MNDFPSQLTAILDDVAGGIKPRQNYEAVRANSVPVVPNATVRSGRLPSLLAIAAVSVLLLGGGVVVAFQLAGDEPDAVATSSAATPPPIDKPSPPLGEPIEGAGATGSASVLAPRYDSPQYDNVGADKEYEHTANLGATRVDQHVVTQKVFGSAKPGEAVEVSSPFGSASTSADWQGSWHLVLTLTDVPEGEVVPLRVSFASSPTVFEFAVVRPLDPAPDTTVEPKPKPPVTTQPKPEPPKTTVPKPEPPKTTVPAPIAFTVSLGDRYQDETYMKQVFYGKAPTGSVITASSEWGSVQSTAGLKGDWEMRLKLTGVPDGTVVHVRVVASIGGSVFEYDLVRDKPEPAPQPVAFTALLGTGYLDWIPMKQALDGVGTPGSVVLASTAYGSADAVVNSNGKWEMYLRMYEVPAGATVHVRVTNNASASVFEFDLVRPASEPAPIDFVAHAAFTQSSASPPFNEYWGTATAGAKVTISSAYGTKYVTSNSSGNWEARVEFPEAPVGETFSVTLSSSKHAVVHSFSFQRVNPT